MILTILDRQYRPYLSLASFQEWSLLKKTTRTGLRPILTVLAMHQAIMGEIGVFPEETNILIGL